MDVAALVLTVIGTVAGVAGAYFAWVAIRPRRSQPAPPLPTPTPPPVGSGTGGPVASQYDVFVSYSHDDADWVHAFADRLEREGVKVAIDKVFMEPGDVLVHEVEQAIRDSTHGLLVFSPASMASGWVKHEYGRLMQRSIEDGRRFIPVVIKDVELPEFAKARYYLDFRNVSATEYDQRVGELVRVLRR